MDDEPKHRKRKGECRCGAHAKGVCADCGHRDVSGTDVSGTDEVTSIEDSTHLQRMDEWGYFVPRRLVPHRLVTLLAVSVFDGCRTGQSIG